MTNLYSLFIVRRHLIGCINHDTVAGLCSKLFIRLSIMWGQQKFVFLWRINPRSLKSLASTVTARPGPLILTFLLCQFYKQFECANCYSFHSSFIKQTWMSAFHSPQEIQDWYQYSRALGNSPSGVLGEFLFDLFVLF